MCPFEALSLFVARYPTHEGDKIAQFMVADKGLQLLLLKVATYAQLDVLSKVFALIGNSREKVVYAFALAYFAQKQQSDFSVGIAFDRLLRGSDNVVEDEYKAYTKKRDYTEDDSYY